MDRDHAEIEWRCRRGMKELELPLRRYFDQRFHQASLDEQQQFLRFLQEPDDRLWAVIFGNDPLHEPAVTELVGKILSCCTPRN